MNNFNKEYERYLCLVNDKIAELFEKIKIDIPENLYQAMRYSVVDGGKRVRPVLMLAVADYLGLDYDKVIDYAVALELIHSYSLVHDDLPAMDNDDYRRGKLSTHKKFGHATGILVGDALLNLAFEVCLNKTNHSTFDIKAIKELFSFSGACGMIKGQYLDLLGENLESEQLLNTIHFNKTAKLLIASFVIPSIVSGHKKYDELFELGEYVGLMFQIKDDILDVEGSISLIGKTPNKDKASGKLTFVSQYGLEDAKNKLALYYKKAQDVIYNTENNEFLLAFLDFMLERKK